MAKRPEQPARSPLMAALVNILTWGRGPLLMLVGAVAFTAGTTANDWRIQLFGIACLAVAGWQIGNTFRKMQQRREASKELARKLEKKQRRKAAKAARLADENGDDG
jgi:hypothetical protein